MERPWQALASDPANIKLALDIARNFARRCPRLWDEFESAAYPALCESARLRDTSDPRAAIITVVTNRMRDTQTSWRPLGYRHTPGQPGPESFRMSPADEADHRAFWVDDPPDDEWSETLGWFAARLHGRHRIAFLVRHATENPAPIADVAAACDCSIKAAYCLVSRAYAKIRQFTEG